MPGQRQAEVGLGERSS